MGSMLKRGRHTAESAEGKGKDSEKDPPVLPRAWVL